MALEANHFKNSDTNLYPNNDILSGGNPQNMPAQEQTKITTPETYYKTEKEEQIITSFRPFGVMSFLYGIFFCFCLYRNVMGMTSPLLCMGTLAFYLYSLHALGITCPMRQKLFYTISICLLGLSNMLTDNRIVIFLNYTGIILLLLCFLLQRFYETAKWDFHKYLGSILQTIFCSVANFGCLFKSLHLFLQKKQNEKSRKLYYVFLGIVISIPLLLVVGSLLLSADAVFRNISDKLLSNLLNNVRLDNLFLIAALLYFGILVSYCILIELANKSLDSEIKERRTMEPIIAITFTSVLTVIYLFFCVIQIMYLFIGNMQLPEHYTYAEYAREGFFQLLFVCLINLCLVLFCKKHYRDNKILKGILTIICGCTYIMIASSAMRMVLYIKSYNLTFLRVFVLTALFVLFFCLTGIVISIYQESFPLFSYMLTVVTVVYIVFSLAKPDSLIASYNIVHFNINSDGRYLYDLSMDAVPVLAKAGFFEPDEVGLPDDEDEDFSEDMDSRPVRYHTYYDKKEYVNRIQESNRNMTIRTFNLSVYRAAKATVDYMDE